MAASPLFLPPATARRTPQNTRNVWIPVLLSLIFIAFTSTNFMCGAHTQRWLEDVWQPLLGSWHFDLTGPVNEFVRKVGHFFGYGAIGLIFRHAWHSTLRARAMRLGAALISRHLLTWSMGLSVLSIFVVASLDEWHQHFVPQRVGSFSDVLRDTAGTVVLNLAWLGLQAYRRRNALTVR